LFKGFALNVPLCFISIIARSSLLSSCGLGAFGVSIGEHAFVNPKSLVESLKGTGFVSGLAIVD